jgi:hypothetical protein
MIQATVEAANAETLTNRNDVILLSGNGTSNKTAAMLEVTNNRVHFVGIDPCNRKMGARAQISNSGTGAATDVSMIKITGSGCSFRNLKLANTWTAAENLYCVSDQGSNNYFENVDIENLGSAHLTNASAASLDYCGAEGIFVNCTIGAHSVLHAVASGQDMLVGAEKASGSGLWDHCRFQAWANAATHCHIRVGASGINSSVLDFEDCIFQNRGTAGGGGLALTAVVATSATLGGRLLFSYPRIDGSADLATSAAGATGVFVVSPVISTAASDCVAIQSS